MRPRTQAGFSLIEVLIASAIFLIIALGVLPLFAQAIRNNLSGRDATDVSNLGKSGVEELLKVPYENLTVPVGATWGCTAEYRILGGTSWTATTAPTPPTPCTTDNVTVASGDALWIRTIQVRQFSLEDLQKTGTANPLPGGAAAGLVHLKEIAVEVRNASANPLSSGKTLTLRMLRAV
jgi:prepilin-type N-terminal cleavage/methylation domain-containing protein